MDKEIFKDIPGFENLYLVSNLGRVYSIKSGKYLKPVKDGHGYLHVILYNNKKQLTKKIHRLVAEAFIDNPYNKPEIDHIDTNKQNNHISNLRWATHKENINNSLTKQKMSELNTGENNPMYGKHHSEEVKKKISESEKGKHLSEETKKKLSTPVLQFDKYGNYINEYYGTREAERRTGIFSTTISACCRGKYKSAGGYIWKFKEIRE